MEPIQEADGDEQNGKPTCKNGNPQSIYEAMWKYLVIVSLFTSPMLMQILLTIWGTKMQLQHISFPQSNDQDI